MIKIFYFALILLLFTSCSYIRFNFFDKSYSGVDVGFHNKGKKEIYKAHIYIDDYKSVGGNIGLGGASTHVLFTNYLPTNYVLTYKFENTDIVKRIIEPPDSLISGYGKFLTVNTIFYNDSIEIAYRVFFEEKKDEYGNAIYSTIQEIKQILE